MIEIRNLVKNYGKKNAVNGLTLEVKKGEIFVLLGPNAAGKTTTIKNLVGLLRPTTGEIRVGGHDVLKDYTKVKRLIRYVPDFPFLYGKLSGMEFLELVADLYGVPEEDFKARTERLLPLFEIWEARHQFTETYSHGMKQKLALTASFVSQPSVLVIDEPMVGLDPASARKFKDLLKEFARDGGTVFLSTHVLSVAEDIADRIGILHRGRLIACGSLAELQARSGGTEQLEKLFLQLTEEEEKGRLDAKG